jgi:hypothetical protein
LSRKGHGGWRGVVREHLVLGFRLKDSCLTSNSGGRSCGRKAIGCSWDVRARSSVMEVMRMGDMNPGAHSV